jgi:FAD/FMN-containing dehydrogenase/ferredoxin
MGIPDLKVISAPGALALYSRDQADVPDVLRSTLFDSFPEAVAQPFSVEAVAAVMKFAAARNIPAVVRGAGSSPFGGSMPVKGGIVLDMNAMDHVLEFDEVSRTVKVQAGMRWADLDWFLEKHELSVRSSPSSRFSTVGGWVATGGIGISSVSGGHLSRSVKALEVVTSDGEVKRLAPSDPKFKALFGSEGRLAVIASVTLEVRKRANAPAPRLVFFNDHATALAYAMSLASSKNRPMDLTYYSPAKFVAFNQLLGKEHFPVAHGVLATYEKKEDLVRASEEQAPIMLRASQTYLAYLLWNERFFPMNFRKLGPGLMGAEVLAPKAQLSAIVAKAQEVCQQHQLEPMIEIHFLEGGDGMLLCYYITDQARQLKYAMDSFRGLLITSALLDAGARPYSFGVWNNAFSDHAEAEEMDGLAAAKQELDPQGIMNRGKYPRLSGRMGGIPAAFFSPGVLGSALKLVNRLGPLSATAVKAVSSSKAFDRNENDVLLTTADQCAMCGACVGVCPAYLATKDERVTARGKLLTARSLANGGEVTKEHAHRTFLCMRCRACEQVCQSKLHLIEVYDELEKRLEAVHGKDGEEIKRFVEQTEHSVAYNALVERGLVLGSASKTVAGGS